MKKVISSIVSYVKYKIWTTGTGIDASCTGDLNPNWIGDQMMIMRVNFDKPECTHDYRIHCMEFLDDCYENIDKIMDGKTNEEQYDIAGSLTSAIVEVHRQLNIKNLEYSENIIYSSLQKYIKI